MEVRQEEDRVPGRKITVIAAIVAGVSAAYIVAAWGIEACGPEGPVSEYRQEVPDEVNAMELTLFDTVLPSELGVREERAYLNSFGWTDAQRGVAHIPIELAIELYLREHGGESEEAIR